MFEKHKKKESQQLLNVKQTGKQHKGWPTQPKEEPLNPTLDPQTSDG